jgi:hypothetical protein
MSSSAITGPILSDVRRSPSGSAAAPSWSFADSTGTGVYLVSAGVLGLSTNGVQRVVVDASGNVGIGGAPNDWGSNYKALEVGNDSGNGWMTGASGYSQSFFTVNSYFNGTAWILKHTGQAKRFVMDPANNSFIFSSAAGTAGQTITWNEHMRIAGSGALTVGSAGSTISHTIQAPSNPAGTAAIHVRKQNVAINTGGNSYIEFYGASGGYDGYLGVTGTTLQVIDASDARKKENIRPANYGLKEIQALKPAVYYWKE